ncbi:MAG TPA: DUF1848 domain-containing protein [Ktedonobacteraceae bacterium]|nr:DUF1848 domain-containing protein [Ktedonobacteraceae bacterium]
MIISASYKTDIPTFYGEWFMNRLRAGYCRMVNPYGGQRYKVGLKREEVDGFVFWTKNIGPFLKYLPEVREKGYPFIVQHSINGYPRELEARVINYEQTVEHMHTLANEYGPDVAIWRYDPIVFSSLTPPYWHLDNFAKLAKALEGATNEVIISFAQIYRKTKRNMDDAAKEYGFDWYDHETITQEQGKSFALELFHQALKHGITLKVCSQAAFLTPGVVEEARCVDAERLEKVAGKAIEAKLKGNRKECGCFESRDIGEYDTCPHGCVYCYAVQRRELALQRFKEHNPDSPYLFPPKGVDLTEDEADEQMEQIQASQVIPLGTVGKRATTPIVSQLSMFDAMSSHREDDQS